MNINEQEALFRKIECVMSELQRQSWRAIMPCEVLMCLVLDVPEKQIQSDMDRLVRLGRLVKVGRGKSRGYRLATRAQQLTFQKKYRMRPGDQINTTEYTEMVYAEIEVAMRKAHRDHWKTVFPIEIQRRLPFDRAEGSLRRDMLSMVSAGRLIRIGGPDARQGYRLPSRMEKLAYTLNRGMWPHKAEYVMSWAN